MSWHRGSSRSATTVGLLTLAALAMSSCSSSAVQATATTTGPGGSTSAPVMAPPSTVAPATSLAAPAPTTQNAPTTPMTTASSTLPLPSRHVGTGRVTVGFTHPFVTSGSASAVIACTTTRSTYTATATGVRVGDVVFDMGVTTAEYRGVGTYPSAVLLAVSAPLLIALPADTSIPVDVSTTGGSMQISGTTSNGREIAGSISWTCPGG